MDETTQNEIPLRHLLIQRIPSLNLCEQLFYMAYSSRRECAQSERALHLSNRSIIGYTYQMYRLYIRFDSIRSIIFIDFHVKKMESHGEPCREHP